MSTAASYLSAVKAADARARARGETPVATPALSFSSSVTTSSEDTILDDGEVVSSDALSYPTIPPTSEQVFSTVHTEFGHCANAEYRYTSQHPAGTPVKPHIEQDPPYYVLFTTYVSYIILILFGHVRDFTRKYFNPGEFKHLIPHDGYAPITSDFDSFYTRRLKARIDDCFSYPVTGVAGRTIVLNERKSKDYNRTFYSTGRKVRALNISSYNYLGFAQARGGCADAVEESIRRYGVSACGTRLEGGSLDLHAQAEALVARFIGQEDALICSMGFATNSTIIPALVGKGCLVVSDELNHASIRFGVRLSGANVRMFKHNDMNALEDLLKEAISQGQPKTHRPWKKILIIVEGLFSMEGTMTNLPVLLELKKKYKFYLFIDEAHSVGALGPHGRGVADYFGVDPRSIDILMGTFTKSFGAAGGYISGSKAVVDRIRVRSHSHAYAEAMTPPVLTQIIASMASIMGVAPALPTHGSTGTITKGRIVEQESPEPYPGRAPASILPSWMDLPPAMREGTEGRDRLRRLAFNSRYLSRALEKLGFIVYGHDDSPIVPLLIFNPGKMALFHRLMLQSNTPIVIVVVAYPATPLVTSRVRFCVSAAHTKADIDVVLKACDWIGDVLDLKHAPGERWSLEKITSNAVELVRMESQKHA
ncbi:PLP-dependent transferase [Gloeophyllum trabeum ATCC 11539]|uniref:serine C-palmitoyltransferase n=1 Tax=Gloeophyllum trabeum (strain ATCC 11539 / FP-39264 / Madison 617) TaxID=670483 RepID=S7PWN3_GLOTA|nr:PLP-dependent transferase [Gloeophyllum trabeum ATCC 11539]EPQ51968.1 PLP-dependent transferase [Gloeophyllum trabeum ATCC 11539]